MWFYLCSLLLAAAFGFVMPDYAGRLNAFISIILAVLMYSMFSQIPFASMKEAFGDRAYMRALLLVNFIFVPIVVWGLAQFLPDRPSVLLGFYLVLLTPCIDYVIVFTALGKGDEKVVLTSMPLLFVVQMVLLPFYLWLFMGSDAVKVVDPVPFIEAFIGIIFVPLVLALLVQVRARKKVSGKKVLSASAWLPVPFMALTLFAVVASQIVKLPTYIDDILVVIPLYLIFMVAMPIIAKYVAAWFKLGTKRGRALLFSSSTRNSLVVLPLALTLPNIGDIVAAVIITQTMIELVSELVYIRVVPKLLLRD